MNTLIIKFIVGAALIGLAYYLANQRIDLYLNGKKQFANFEEVKLYKGGNKRKNKKKPDGYYVYYNYKYNNQNYQGHFKVTKSEAENKYNNFKAGDEIEIFVSNKNPQNSDITKDLNIIIILVCFAFLAVGIFLVSPILKK